MSLTTIKNKKWLVILSFFLAVVLITGIFNPFGNVTPIKASDADSVTEVPIYAPGDEMISERTENAKKFYLGENSYALDIALAAIHYKDNYQDKSEQWKDIDLTFDKDHKITKAPYELVVDPGNYSITVKDKKTDQVTTLRLNKIGDKDARDIKTTAVILKNTIQWNDVDTDLDLAITPDTTRVNFDWIVKSENAPHQVEFDIEDGGIPIVYRGTDADGEEVAVTVEKNGNKIVERIEKGGKYPKVINPSFDFQVSSSTDDGVIHTSGDYYTDILNQYVGFVPLSSGTIFRFHSWYRWTGFYIPNGSTINSNSYISLSAKTSVSSSRLPNTVIYFDDEQSPGYPTSYSNYLSRPLTTNNVLWNFSSWVANNWYYSGSIQNIIQELVNSYGDLTALQCMHKDCTPYLNLLQKKIISCAYDYSTSRAAKIHIEYTPPTPCSILIGTNYNYKITGGEQSQASIQGVRADLGSYNPNPVFQQTTFWIMLDNNLGGSSSRYAQVGWIRTSGDSNEYIWLQYTDDGGGTHNMFYDTTSGSWSTTRQSVPSGSNKYTVEYDSGSKKFSMKFGDNGTPFTTPGTLQWVPNRLAVYGETANYGATYLGDHVPGDLTTPVQAQAIQKKLSGNWSDASPTYQHQGNGAYDNIVTTSPGFRIWDIRCAN